MNTDEKLKQEQLEYYKRENELREEAKQKHDEIVENNKNMVKAIGIVMIALLIFIVGCMILGTIKSLISDFLFQQYLKLH